MKTYARWLWMPALVGALGVLTMGEASAHRGGGEDARDGARAGRICAAARVRQPMMRLGAQAADPAIQAVRDLVALECLYRREGRSDQIEPLYRDALAKSAQPLVRSVAYRRLARMAWRKGEHAAAEDLLKRSLQENIK